MGLKLLYDTQEDIPEAHRDLFSEKDGKFVLTGIDGLKTQADVDKVSEALRKERGDHATTKAELAKFNGLDPDEVHTKLDRIPELEAAAEGNLSKAKIDELVEARLAATKAPLERQIATLNTELATAIGERDGLKSEQRAANIRQKLTDAAVKAKVVETALDDIVLYGERVFDQDDAGNITVKDGVGLTPGLDPSAWLSDMQEKRPHWWPPSEGGGAGGGGGGGGGVDNPWSAKSWNMTRQSQLYREDPARAEQLAKLAGTTIGGARPTA